MSESLTYTDNLTSPVYLRYRNHKMRREAVVPIDDELATMIEAQQARTRQRFPTTGVLLRRGSANPDGRLPIPTATFHLQLGQWLQTCGFADELGPHPRPRTHPRTRQRQPSPT